MGYISHHLFQHGYGFHYSRIYDPITETKAARRLGLSTVGVLSAVMIFEANEFSIHFNRTTAIINSLMAYSLYTALLMVSV